MMVQVFSLTIFFLTRLSSSSVIREEQDHPIACDNDFDCGKETFCSIETYYCEECIPCTKRFNRQPATNNPSCAKTEQDCGYCLPGYAPDAWTNERNFSTKCFPSAELVSSNPTTSESPSALTIFNVSAFLVIMIILALFAFFSKSIMQRILPPNNEDIEMNDREPLPNPSAPYAECDPEESSEEVNHLINSSSVSTVQVEDRHCGAVPIGSHHVYHPVTNAEVEPLVQESNTDENEESNVDTTNNTAPSVDLSQSTNSPFEMSRLNRQISAAEQVRPPLFRSASDSGMENPHIRLSHQRPNIMQSINSSDQLYASQETVQDQSQLPFNQQNYLEVGMSIIMKRNKK